MRRLTWFNTTSLTLGFAFLYLPMVILVIYSFNSSKLVTVWAGFSTKWYGELMRNEAFLDAAWVTIKVAVLSSTFATVLGTLAAYVLVRAGRFWGRTLFSGMIYAPLVMPEVITGLSLLLLFIGIGLDRGVMTIVLAHATFSMCYVSVVVSSRLATFDMSLEEAALDLGSTRLRHFVWYYPSLHPRSSRDGSWRSTLSLDDLVIASSPRVCRPRPYRSRFSRPCALGSVGNQCALNDHDRNRDHWRDFSLADFKRAAVSQRLEEQQAVRS